MPLGLYISVPFCRTKCSYCNFASDVFSHSVFQRYVDRVCADLQRSPETAGQLSGRFERLVDSVYLGGGSPTILDVAQLERVFVTISQNFEVSREAEITVECAPGTLSPALLDVFGRCAVNRVSLGVQSFVDQETRAVGRLHTRETTIADIVQLRAVGISNINVDLIAGLPHQTMESWDTSLAEIIASGVPHVSVYMLEVDNDSRLGRELIAGGTKYHAHFVPNEDLIANLYERACERLEATGIHQYEISNFAKPGSESQHNLKYWTRQPYMGFGVDAHSMLLPLDQHAAAMRFAAPDSLENYLAGTQLEQTILSREGALEEALFLGLRLTRGVDLEKIAAEFGQEAIMSVATTVADLVAAGLMEQQGSVVRLSPRGRLLSNEVFERFVSVGDRS